MPTPDRAKLKPKQLIWLAVLGLVVLAVLAVLVYLLFGLNRAEQAAAVRPRKQFSLPTAPVATITPGPPLPNEILFVAKSPLKGYSSCTHFGFRGKVLAGNGKQLQNVQIIAWSKEKGLLALADLAADGRYSIRIPGRPAPRELWVQVFKNDVPVSEPVQVQTHINCQNGFQIYQVDWQEMQP